MNATVALLYCPDYNLADIKNKINQGLALLGGIEQFVSRGEKILLKPNLLAGDEPEKAVTVHPVLFQGVAEIFQTFGVNLSYGDSPGRMTLEKAASKAGLAQVAQQLNIPLADFNKSTTYSFPQANIAKQLKLAACIDDIDGIIGLSKMKTHPFLRITGAVKNQFGLVPGLLKAEYHVKMPDIYTFSRVLADINLFIKPRLYIMDGITAMEGNGPRGGRPRSMKALLMSCDPVALDSVFCRLINMNPSHVPTNAAGDQVKLGTCDLTRITIVGDKPEDMVANDFAVWRSLPPRFISARYFPTFLKNLVSPKPYIVLHKCLKCGTCIDQCPVNPKALNWNNKKKNHSPVYNYQRCLRCYCCQEICPASAIEVKVPLLGKLIQR